MEWINLHTSVIDSAEFMTAEPVDRATWLCLQRYCVGQENSGRILGAKGWTDRIWLQMCGVSLREVTRSCGLWAWDGDDLTVTFYNIESEKKVQRLRGQAASAGHASWQKRSSPQGEPSVEPHGSPAGSSHGDAKGKEREGKGKEGKEIPPNPQGGGEPGANSNPPRKRSPKAGSVLPSEQPAEIHDRMLRVGALMGRRESTPWSAEEFGAFLASRLDRCAAAEFEDQLGTLRPYYGAKIARENDYRRRDLRTLLNNWPGELDRARAFNRDHNDGIEKR